MTTINKQEQRIPLKNLIKLNKAEKGLRKSGVQELQRVRNNKGDVAVLGFNNPQRDELVISTVIKKDGTETMNKYFSFPKNEENGKSFKIIETWNKVKNNYVFNKRVTMQYGDSKRPEVISTVCSDAEQDDGVTINRKFFI